MNSKLSISGGITPELVIDYWDYMQKHYDLKIVKKSTSKIMAAARLFTGMSKEEWARFSTTIGHTLYTDMVPGVVEPGHSLLYQILLITHECQHVWQSGETTLHGVYYLTSSAKRAMYEADAYTCNIEMYYKLTGKLIPVQNILDTLGHYQLSAGDIAGAKYTLDMRSLTIKSGGLITAASKMGMMYFTTLGLESRRAIKLESHEDFNSLL